MLENMHFEGSLSGLRRLGTDGSDADAAPFEHEPSDSPPCLFLPPNQQSLQAAGDERGPPPHKWTLISCSSKGPDALSLLSAGTCFTSSLWNCSVSGDLLWGEATTAGLRHCIGLSLLAGGVWEQLGVPGKGRAPGLCGAVGGACLLWDPGKSCHLIFQTVRGAGGQEDLQVTPTSKGLHVTFCPPPSSSNFHW